MNGHHGHSHAPADYGRAFAVGIGLNLAFVLVEALVGWRVGSLSLVADAGHNLSDVGGLLIAWAGFAASRRRATDRHTYGWQRVTILAGFANAVILLVVMGSLALAAVQRLRTPAPIEGNVVMLVAGIGVLVNAVTAWMFAAGSRADLNIRGAYLHMMADALVSVGVVLAGALYVWRGWLWIDPAVTLVIVTVIIVGTWSLFRQSLHLLVDGVPDTIELRQVEAYLASLPGVESVHDLHVWATGTSSTALTAHLVMPAGYPGSSFFVSTSKELHDRFEIVHPTLQIETELLDDDCCAPPPARAPH